MTIPSPAAAAPGAHEAPHPGADTKWWTLTAVCLGTFMLLVDLTIVNVALPDIQASLSASLSDVQWVVDAYALTLAVFLLTAGSLADLYGRRRLYLVGLVVFTAASALCGIAQSPLMLELSRGLQGIGGAIMFSVSLALMANAFRGAERGLAFGVWGALAGVAAAVGPIVGGVLVSGLSWRWIFFVNVPIGAIALALTMVRVVESRDEQAARPDWPGFVLFSGALACFDLRAHRIRAQQLHGHPGDRLLRRHRGAAHRLPAGRDPKSAPDVRPTAVPGAHLRRRRPRRVRPVLQHLLHAALRGPLPAERARITAPCRPACGCSPSPSVSWSPASWRDG